jgi:hypothetical protein
MVHAACDLVANCGLQLNSLKSAIRNFLFWIIWFPVAAFASDLPSAPVPNQLPAGSGISVSVEAPFGFRYRPGYALPLRFKITNVGPQRTADVFIVEGSDDSGSRPAVFSGQTFASRASRQSELVEGRAPSVQADLSVIVRDASSDNGVALFKGSLKPVLQPLEAETRMVLCCGYRGASALTGQFFYPVLLSAEQLPTENWMYEPVDLVILGDGSVRNAKPDATGSLRKWLLSGGCVLVASPDALNAAIAAKLLPLDESAGKQFPSDPKWWEEHCGARVLKRKENQQPVYAEADLGLGRVVFLFPGNSESDAATYGTEIINRPELKRQREHLTDLRIQPAAFNGRVQGGVGPERIRTSANFFGIGALIFCGVLALCLLIRSKLEAIGWVVCIAAVLAVMLTHFFRVPKAIVSRVQWSRVSADGRELLKKEWASVETFHGELKVSVNGPAQGTIVPLFPDPDHLSDAQFDSEAGSVNDLRVPGSALIFASVSDSAPHDEKRARTIHSRSDGTALTFWPSPLVEKEGVKLGIWVRPDSSVRYIEKIEGDTFTARDFDDTTSAICSSIGTEGGPAAVKARAAVLDWAIRSAKESGRDTLVFWTSEREAGGSSLVEFASEPPEEGARFAVWSLEAGRQSLATDH